MYYVQCEVNRYLNTIFHETRVQEKKNSISYASHYNDHKVYEYWMAQYH